MKAKDSLISILMACGFLTSAVANATPQFFAQTWQSEDGLPSNAVRAIAQASEGYLWVGTAEGIVRFDGVRLVRSGCAWE